MLRFAEEIILLLLNDDDGTFARVSRWSLDYVLAGGVLMDLALENPIDTDLDNLILVDATPVGDSLLDPTRWPTSKRRRSVTPVSEWSARQIAPTQSTRRLSPDWSSKAS